MFMMFSATIIVGNPSVEAQEPGIRPVAVIEPFPDVNIDDLVVLDGSGSYYPDSQENTTGEIIEWEWFVRGADQDWTEQSVIGTGETVLHTFNVPGEFEINLTVTDIIGAKGWTEKLIFVGGPDLLVAGIEFRKPEIIDLKEGDVPEIHIYYSNFGSTSIETPWVLKVTNNEEIIFMDTINEPLESGHQGNIRIDGIELDGGPHLFEVTVDVDDDVPEVAEENNVFRTSVIVGDGSITTSSENIVFPITLMILIFMILGMIIVMVGAPLTLVIIIMKMSKKKN